MTLCPCNTGTPITTTQRNSPCLFRFDQITLKFDGTNPAMGATAYRIWQHATELALLQGFWTSPVSRVCDRGVESLDGMLWNVWRDDKVLKMVVRATPR
jgi:hypothetical protein